jgi:hypothetical protein
MKVIRILKRTDSLKEISRILKLNFSVSPFVLA